MRYVRSIFTAADGRETLESLLNGGRLPSRQPDLLKFDMERAEVDEDWRAHVLSAPVVSVKWYRHGDRFANDNVYISRDDGLLYCNLDLEVSVEGFIDYLEQIPFVLASFRGIYPEWTDRDYDVTGFGDGHIGHGPACAFRGAGHDRLVSRRWLDYGPWRVIRLPGDLNVVQFHDFHADMETAHEQSASGHQRMGISRTGGFIQKRYVYAHDLKGLYEPVQKRHKIVVHGREVTQSEMLDAAALRHDRRSDPDKPIDSIAYVFAVPEEAHAHLHEMWLRELEVWTFDPATGKEIRLDEDYEPPPPDPPEWVKRLNATE